MKYAIILGLLAVLATAKEASAQQYISHVKEGTTYVAVEPVSGVLKNYVAKGPADYFPGSSGGVMRVWLFGERQSEGHPIEWAYNDVAVYQSALFGGISNNNCTLTSTPTIDSAFEYTDTNTIHIWAPGQYFGVGDSHGQAESDDYTPLGAMWRAGAATYVLGKKTGGGFSAYTDTLGIVHYSCTQSGGSHSGPGNVGDLALIRMPF